MALSNISFAGKTYLARAFQDALKQMEQIKNFTADSRLREEKLNLDGYLFSEAANENFALIIGETHARSNMSVYGYSRETTPWLNKAVADKKVILLQNGFSNAAVTTHSLEYALTAKNQYNDILYKDAATITEIAKTAGFKVVWISNQVNDNIVGRIGEQADEQCWLNKNYNDTWIRQKNNTFDDKIIDCLKEIKKPKTRTLFVINLLGSHASYDCRYPKEFRRWDDDFLINAYDNSVLYNDYVMSEIYRLLFDKLAVGGMMYFSDHGEELKIKYCHGTEFFYDNYKKYPSVKEIVKIPVYFSFSDKYKKKYPETIDNLNRNKTKYFTNDMVYDTMLGIMHMSQPYYNPNYDITSDKYSMKLEQLRTLHGKVKLEDCL